MLTKKKVEQKRTVDPSYAHVLMHGLARIYNHTPYPVRQKRLEKFRKDWPELVTACLRSCSQVGRAEGKE